MPEAAFYYKNPAAPRPNKPPILGACAIIQYRSTYLMESRADSDRWAFIGGAMEPEESLEDCILREIREETGLTVTLDTGFRAVVTYSPKPDVMKDVIYFAAEYIGGEAHRQVEEVTELCWVPAEEAAAHITFENDKDVLRKYREYCKA